MGERESATVDGFRVLRATTGSQHGYHAADIQVVCSASTIAGLRRAEASGKPVQICYESAETIEERVARLEAEVAVLKEISRKAHVPAKTLAEEQILEAREILGAMSFESLAEAARRTAKAAAKARGPIGG